MKYLVFLAALIFFTATITSAQKTSFVLKGQLSDSMQKQQVQDATVSLVNAKDSSLVGFTRTDSAGRFSFDRLKPGKYRLSASQVNFHPLWKTVELTADADLGPVIMKDKSIMQEVTVTAQRPPVVVNGDTLEFNAEAFKTKPNAVVEDLLKKLPGVMVDKEGNITVNGKPVNRILVDGKVFFGDDPKMATRNLPANVIDKVQVADDKEEAMRNGDDNMNNVGKVVNITLKKGVKKGWFGKLYAGAGSTERF